MINTAGWTDAPSDCGTGEGGTALAGKFRADVLITYVRSGETVTHSTTGSITGNVE